MEEKIVYTADEVGEVLHLSMPSVYKAIRVGKIPSIKIGRRVLIPVHALKTMLANVGQTPCAGAK